MIAPAIPQVGLSVKEASRLLCMPRLRAYKHIHKGKLRAFKDEQGILKIDPAEISRYLREEQ